MRKSFRFVNMAEGANSDVVDVKLSVIGHAHETNVAAAALKVNFLGSRTPLARGHVGHENDGTSKCLTRENIQHWGWKPRDLVSG